MIFPVHLRCEYRLDPRGIDVLKPRLSWLLDTTDHSLWDQIQSAYQIRVATTEKILYGDNPDLWDSGKIESNRTNQIEYEGKPLPSRTGCRWMVRVWDGDGNVSDWSEPALWTMGLLDPDDWKARWIGYDAWEKSYDEKKQYRFTEGEDEWIWGSGERDIRGTFYFRHTFTVDKIEEIIDALFLVTADESFILFINGIEAERSDNKIFSWTRPSLTEIKKYLCNGNNIVGIAARNSYLDKPGLTGKLYLRFAGGSQNLIRIDSRWKVSNQHEEGWCLPDYDDSDWESARRVAIMGDKPWRVPEYKLKLPPPPYLRKTFTLHRTIRRAYVYASALGLYELRINGRKVSGDKLTPGWTDYSRRVYYNSYDITKDVKEGVNCLGMILADGWYSGYIGWERRREYYGKHPQAIAQLEIEYEDGSNQLVITDDGWKAAFGAIREADLLMGEYFDAGIDDDMKGWDTAIFNDADWNRVVVSEDVKPKLQAYPGNPVICVREMHSQKLYEPKTGVYVFDLGQNIAGYVRLKIREPRGTRIVIRHGEEINSDGTLYTGNLRMARATDVYIARGSGEEIWEPRFTYHGFRYVELTGCTHPPGLDAVTGCVIHSGMDETGTFNSSNDLINKLYENIKWTQRGNFIDIPTDCPQRDERLGWTDNHHFFPTASYNMDVAAFYSKWLIDLNDAQDDEGAYPPIAPKPDLGVGPLYAGASGWADAGILIPYNLYKRYGDVRVLQMYYPNMVRYIEYLCRNSEQYIRPDYGYGDWLSVDADTPGALIGTVFFARVCGLMSEIARILDKTNDSLKYSDLHKNIKQAFMKLFVNDDGRISGDTQTGYVLAIQFGLLDAEIERRAFQHLVSDIESRRYHISTGFLGIPYILHVLTKHNRTDIAYRLIQNEAYPSWGYMVKNGATTMWERWNSRTPEDGFFNPLMNSFNHCSLGAFGDWLYEVPGGIREQIQKDVDFIIRPETCDSIDSCVSSFRSVKGDVRVSWEVQAKVLTIDVQIPVNARAAVVFPDNCVSTEIRKGKCRDEQSNDRGKLVLHIGSGEYIFRYYVK